MTGMVTRSQVGTMVYIAPTMPLIEDEVCEALSAAISESFAAGELQLILDLEQVSLLAGPAMEIMLDGSQRLATVGGGLKFVNPSLLVRDVLIAAGLADPLADEALNFGELQAVGGHYFPPSTAKLGEILLEMGFVTQKQLGEVALIQARSNKRMGTILVESGMVSERNRLAAIGRQMGIPFIPLRIGLFETRAAKLLPREVARRLEVLPMFKVNDTLVLATHDPQAIPALDEIQDVSGCKLRLVLAEQQDILKYLGEAYSGNEFIPEMIENMATDIELVAQEQSDFARIDEMAGASPVVSLVNGLIQRAVRDGASDIHVECGRLRSYVRFRIDGVLYEAMSLRPDLHPAIISRLKVMSNLDIAERRLPQDGRMQVVTQGRNIDLRLSSLPGIYGEKIVLRVLDKNQSILDIEKLGLRASNLARLKKLLSRSHGLLLITGPTGSGKTTSLYASVNHLKSVEKNIVTIEDPVEYQIDMINQNQVNEPIGLGFARMLKHILRQDPDIIMVGEIRDRDTAEIAVQAALTGHLVLSTLHTNNAVGAISRMVDMGIEPYLLSSALAGVVAQRLVRGVCPNCKTTYLPPPEMIARYQWPDNARLTRGKGCSQCYDSGYRGRLGIHEIIESSDSLQRLMARNPTKDELLSFARSEGYPSLFDDGVQRAFEGRTTIEEVSRVIQED